MTELAAPASAPTRPLHDASKAKAVVDGDEVEGKAEQTRAATKSSASAGDAQNDIATLKKPGVEGATTIPASDKTINSTSEARAHWRAVQAALGGFLETVEAQVGLILLIAADVCASGAQMYIQTCRDLEETRRSRSGDLHDLPVSSGYVELGAAIAIRSLGAVSTVAIGVYLLELAVLLAVFKRQFVTHSGYAFDAALVVATVAIEAWTESKAIRLLGVLRVWRVFRVVTTVIESERAAHEASKALLDLERATAMQLWMEKSAAEESLKREYTSRTGLERLLYDYKDEVATLKEALEIAAQAVAEAEMLNVQYAEGSASLAAGTYSAIGDEQQYLQGQEVNYQPQGEDEDAYSYDADSSIYQQALDDGSFLAPEKLPDDPESDFEDAVQSDSER